MRFHEAAAAVCLASIPALCSDAAVMSRIFEPFRTRSGGINGVELAKQTQRLRPDIKILLSSKALEGLRGPGGDDRYQRRTG